MRYLLISLFLAACSEKREPTVGEITTRQLVNDYNNGRYKNIFRLFDAAMQEALPLEKTTAYFSGMKNEDGLLMRYTQMETKAGSIRYHASFERAEYWMSVETDSAGKIRGLFFREYDGPGVTALMERNSTPLSLPFKGEWTVFWGGDNEFQNYHVVSRSQKNAFDLLITDTGGKSYRTDGKTNADYYAFGAPIFAPCDGEVEEVKDGIADNFIGFQNPDQPTGNTVLLRAAAGEFCLLAHFKQNSVRVKKGDKVKKGTLLGLCGNSGNSTEPHLHFHLQDKPYMRAASGVKCYFDSLLVNGQPKKDYSPVKGEKILNAEE